MGMPPPSDLEYIGFNTVRQQSDGFFVLDFCSSHKSGNEMDCWLGS